MPTGTLPSTGKALWEKVYKKALSGSCKDKESPEECAAGSAWTAVKGAGWRKDSEGKWTHKAELSEFSFTVKRAAFDKVTQEMRWRADTSDIEVDKREDNMTQELYADFLRYIEEGILAPEEYRSDFWEGGLPYVSVSHYPDLNGSGVPGPTEQIYVDGKFLKAKGKFDDTPLGRACFKALCDDLYGEKENADHDRIRISIAFLDYAHRHKSDGSVFEREKIGDICSQCILELFGVEERAGVEYLKGQLIHLALTRVPVNDRTLMEVDRSMTTRKEDAASIIGEELADELEEQAAVVGKSEALVIKAEDEEVPTEIVEEAKSEKKKDKDEDEDEEDEKKKKEKKEKSEAVPEVSLAILQQEIVALKAVLAPEPVLVHPLDEAMAKLKADFDEAVGVEMTPDERLQVIQDSYSGLGSTIKSLVETPQVEEVAGEGNELVKALSEVMLPLGQKLDMLINRLDRAPLQKSEGIPKSEGVPYPRNIQPNLSAQLQQKSEVTKQVSETPKLRKLLERTV